MIARDMLRSGASVTAGVSGGADSVALLEVLNELKAKLDLRLFVVHINHGLREEALAEEKYVESLCKERDIPFYLFKEDVKEGLEALDTLASSTFDIKKNIIDSATRDIIELVNVIANKVCHTCFDSEMLYKITIDAIKLLNDKENITIIVSPVLVDNLHKMIPDIRASISNLQTIKILEDSSLSPDGVIVETLNTRLDSRISSQINELTQKMLTGGDNGMGQK